MTAKVNNINLLFNKLYYDALDPQESEEFERTVSEMNRKIFNQTFQPTDFSGCKELEEFYGESFKNFRLKTDYPGLLIGTGNPHGSGLTTSDINCGFSFSYVTGQPYIPASSVKGILRSSFKARRPAVIDFLEEILNLTEKPTEDIVQELETDIFEGDDIFLDGVLAKGAAGGKFLGADYITPHYPLDKDLLKNPNPIHILKVLPDVTLEFRFILHSATLSSGLHISASDKTALFSKLLCYFGIGAKTNVGYGILLPIIESNAPTQTAVPQNVPPGFCPYCGVNKLEHDPIRQRLQRCCSECYKKGVLNTHRR